MDIDTKNDSHHTINFGVFGLYRWLLASMVAVAHLAPAEIIHVGYYAVFGFFTLSGYLMALVFHDKYCYLPEGVSRFYLNRLLRIYPSYLVVALVTCAVIYYAPDSSPDIHARLLLPDTIIEAISNVSALGLTGIYGSRSEAILVPPAWSLGVEIFFWLLFPIFFKFKDNLNAWTIFSLFFISIFTLSNSPIVIRYFSPLGSSIAFCAGVWCYYCKDIMRMSYRTGHMAIIMLIIICCTAHLIFKDPLFEGFYLAFFLNVGVIFYLSRIDQRKVSPAYMKIDKFLGDISYPIFLTHILSGICVYLASDRYIAIRSIDFFLYSFLLSHIFSILLLYGVEKRIQKIRQRISQHERTL